jgi:hypothetical protein
VVCLLPVAIWRVELRRQRAEQPAAAEPEPEPEPLPEPIPLRPVPALPLPDLPAAAAPRERRKRHQMVRFERRREHRPLEPVREFAHGRRKDHVVVRFAPPQGSPVPVQDTEPDLAWQMFGEAEA